ncbi:MAG: ABC transporter substrate-binding protein, partial [Anaerolineae bacterium]
MWKSVSVLMVLTMLLAGLAACGPTPEPQVVEKTVIETVIVEGTPQVVEKVVTEVVEVEKEVEKVVTATPEPVSKVITFAWTQEPDSMNWLYSNMWFASILQQIFHCWAWQWDDQNQIYPYLLTEIPSMDNGGVSEDGLVITMDLRDDIVWSDGTPITADDFAFTYQMIMDPNNTVVSQYPYDQLVSVEAADERTVVMTFAEPFSPWMAWFWRGVLPKHIIEPVFEAEGTMDEAEWNRAPTVGCGPYDFAEWESGSYQRFVKNPNYWGEAAKIDEIYLQFVPDDASQTAALIAGDADLGTFPPLSDVPILQAGGLEIMIGDSGYAEGWYFNFRDMAPEPIKDVRV